MKSVMQIFNSHITTVNVEKSKNYSETEGEHIAKLDGRIASSKTSIRNTLAYSILSVDFHENSGPHFIDHRVNDVSTFPLPVWTYKEALFHVRARGTQYLTVSYEENTQL